MDPELGSVALEALIEAIEAIAQSPAPRAEDTDTPIVLAARNVGVQGGDIEIVRDALGDALRSTLALSPGPRSAPEETAREVHDRCLRQLANEGRWPLSRTAEIAAQEGYRRVE